MDLSLGKLQHLVSVARCGSFSRAAMELNLSQPALSRSIATIEERYGFAIFNRVGHGVEPTAAGLQVLEQARPLLEGLRVFESNMGLLAGGRGGRLSMGMAPLLASELVPRFTGDFFGTSDTQLRVMVRPGEELVEALANNEVEMIFFPGPHVADAGEIELERVGDARPACVVRQGHPLTGRKNLQLADLADYPWASSVEDPVGPPIPSRSRMVCDNYHILRDAVMATELVCICSQAFIAEELRDGRLVEIVIDGLPLPPTAIFAGRLKGRVHSPLAARALAAIRGYLAA
ncbi:DNA-binding transcriptional LysR family regulator [Novosphingobium sp. PhB165]|uniref:LysR family transcriptional regulator n=1 Tax=Novosphingobium sp. PhB165 TaxID=2485105 RepID=UPI001045ACD2|nr:LysR family transcriptional regulator [Novosphingobium sp. PhB165]TCM20729.1 DNA-binding transcriptional LysR family regulator [Novosphingobium sp. PhB165]